MQTLTLAEYAERWLEEVKRTRKFSTARRYEQILRHYIVPTIGDRPMQSLRRADCKQVLINLLDKGRAKATARAVLAVLQSLCTTAVVDDEILEANPALGLGRRLRIVTPQWARKEEIRALTVTELRTFLTQAWQDVPHLAPIYEVYARAGLRLGEGLALKWEDVGPESIRVMRTYSDRRVTTPKSGHGRTVEIGPDLYSILDRLPRRSAWCFPSVRTGHLWDPTYLDRVSRRVGEQIKVFGVHPHILRHTYASLLLAQGEPPEWVSRQLGHQSLELTIVCYGRWIEAKNPAGLRYFDGQLSRGMLTPRVRRRAEARIRLIPGGRVT